MATSQIRHALKSRIWTEPHSHARCLGNGVSREVFQGRCLGGLAKAFKTPLQGLWKFVQRSLENKFKGFMFVRGLLNAFYLHFAHHFAYDWNSVSSRVCRVMVWNRIPCLRWYCRLQLTYVAVWSSMWLFAKTERPYAYWLTVKGFWRKPWIGLLKCCWRRFPKRWTKLSTVLEKVLHLVFMASERPLGGLMISGHLLKASKDNLKQFDTSPEIILVILLWYLLSWPPMIGPQYPSKTSNAST